MWVSYLPFQSIYFLHAARCKAVSKSVFLLQGYLFQFQLFSQSLTPHVDAGQRSSEPCARTATASQSNESLAAAPCPTSSPLLTWKRDARLICFAGIWIQASLMPMMYCGNSSEAPYQHKVGKYIETVVLDLLCGYDFEWPRPRRQFSFVAAALLLYLL